MEFPIITQLPNVLAVVAVVGMLSLKDRVAGSRAFSYAWSLLVM